MQVKVLTISEKYDEYAKKVAAALEDKDIRVELDMRSEKLGYKIREARMSKVPYIVIIGENEEKNQTVSVRQRDAEVGKQDLGEMSVEELCKMMQ